MPFHESAVQLDATRLGCVALDMPSLFAGSFESRCCLSLCSPPGTDNVTQGPYLTPSVTQRLQCRATTVSLRQRWSFFTPSASTRSRTATLS